MSRLKKVKKANGQIIACNEVRVDADGHGAQSPSAIRGEDPAAPLGYSHVREICDGLYVSMMKECVTDVSIVVYIACISHRSSRRTPPP